MTNSGLAAVDGFTLHDLHGLALRITAVAGGSWTSTAGTETIVVEAPLGPGESVAITETVEVLACTPP